MSKKQGNGTAIVKTKLEKAKEAIFFEKQEGRLCGQHCLNNALQSRMFDAVDLSTIAQVLDEEERVTMAERGTNTQEYRDFINKPSSNYDDSGYFSIQVLTQAFKNVNLDLVNWKSDDDRAVNARKDPAQERLFICHMDDHWLAIRRFGPQWVNLNSNLKQPELLTDTYLSVYLQAVQAQGYIIYAVFGELPECDAEPLFKDLRRNGDGKYIDELLDPGYTLGSANADNEEVLLQRGIDLSLSKTPAEAIRRQREQFLKRLSNAKEQTVVASSLRDSDSVISSPSNVTDSESSSTTAVGPSTKS